MIIEDMLFSSWISFIENGTPNYDNNINY